MKQIIVTDKLENKYTLEFTRETIMQLERKGFNINEVETKPMTTVKMLFSGAFIAHHKNVTQSAIDEIYAGLPDKAELLTKMVELYSEPLSTLMDEPQEKKATWEANW